jgi:hypothetical protein
VVSSSCSELVGRRGRCGNCGFSAVHRANRNAATANSPMTIRIKTLTPGSPLRVSSCGNSSRPAVIRYCRDPFLGHGRTLRSGRMRFKRIEQGATAGRHRCPCVTHIPSGPPECRIEFVAARARPEEGTTGAWVTYDGFRPLAYVENGTYKLESAHSKSRKPAFGRVFCKIQLSR